MTIWRTWLADRSPPCRVQNSHWRPLTPSLGRSASQSCTTGRWHRSPAHGVGAVALAVQDADGTAGLGNVGGLEVQRLLDAKASPMEGGRQVADLGVGEDLGGALAHRAGYLKRLPCRFSF